MMYKCACCKEAFKRSDIEVDHKESVIPLSGFDTWDGLIERLFCKPDGRQVLCIACHQRKSAGENRLRT